MNQARFHLSAAIPEDASRKQRVEIMAKGFETALNHAATDPEIRLRMLMGEAYAKWRELLDWFAAELDKEGPEARNLARRFLSEGGFDSGNEDQRRVLSHQLALLSRVIDE